jgi:hypothetical protein
MAEKGPKAKAKPAPEQRNVLGTLPATRPERLGAPRANGTKAKPAAKRKPAAAKRKPAATRVNGAAPKPRPSHGPTAVRPGSPPLQSHHRPEDAPPPRRIERPHGTELVTTAIRATGELAQIGLTYSGHLLKRAVDRIPRP